MCGRFANERKARELAEELAATISAGADAWSGSFNLAPSKDAPILVEVPDRRLGLARFGLSSPSGRLLINARAETLTTKPTFAEAASRRRCVVPATGFYEWDHAHERRTPHHVRAASGELMLLAALYDVVHDERGAKQTRFAIVTVPAVDPVARIHDRMPLLVPRGLLDSWLQRGELDATAALDAIARARPVELAMHPVSADVGDAANDDPHLVEPVDPERDGTGWLDFGDR